MYNEVLDHLPHCMDGLHLPVLSSGGCYIVVIKSVWETEELEQMHSIDWPISHCKFMISKWVSNDLFSDQCRSELSMASILARDFLKFSAIRSGDLFSCGTFEPFCTASRWSMVSTHFWSAGNSDRSISSEAGPALTQVKFAISAIVYFSPAR